MQYETDHFLPKTSTTIPAAGSVAIGESVDLGGWYDVWTDALAVLDIKPFTADQLPDNETVTCSLVLGNGPSLRHPLSTTRIVTIRGANGTGHPGGCFCMRPPEGGRYAALKIESSEGANAQGINQELKLAITFEAL
jgi:hypothetical protein